MTRSRSPPTAWLVAAAVLAAVAVYTRSLIMAGRFMTAATAARERPLDMMLWWTAADVEHLLATLGAECPAYIEMHRMLDRIFPLLYGGLLALLLSRPGASLVLPQFVALLPLLAAACDWAENTAIDAVCTQWLKGVGLAGLHTTPVSSYIWFGGHVFTPLKFVFVFVAVGLFAAGLAYDSWGLVFSGRRRVHRVHSE